MTGLQPVFAPSEPSSASVLAVAASPVHGFSKQPCASIRLVDGLGVAGDAHAGGTVRHRSRVAKDPTRPNLRQVHLVHSELFDEVAAHGFSVVPGDLGENVTTRGVDLLGLPVGAVLRLGEWAEVELTGLRTPCWQIDRFRDGLLGQMVGRDDAGRPVLKAGVMAVVRRGGDVRPNDPLSVVLPSGRHRPLTRV
jgi:MOSC domain-containing protein YiiM